MRKSNQSFVTEVANYLTIRERYKSGTHSYTGYSHRFLSDFIREGSVIENQAQMDILYKNHRWYDIAVFLELHHGVAMIKECDTALIGDFTLCDTVNAFATDDIGLLKKTIRKSVHHLGVVMDYYSILPGRSGDTIPKKIAMAIIDELCKNDKIKLKERNLYFILRNNVTKKTKQKVFDSAAFRYSKTAQRKCIAKCPQIMKGMTLDEVKNTFTLTGSEFLRVFTKNETKKIVVPSGFMAWAQKDIMVGRMGKKRGYARIPDTCPNVVEV